MKISGIQRLTLLDFPGRTACTVFTPGCNLRCPFCHNASLALNTAEESFNEAELFSYLEKRRGVLDGVAITGGEPLLQKDIVPFIRRIYDMGFQVKLDTNGFFPTALSDAVSSGCVSYIAMDIKNSIEKYAETVGIRGVSLDNVLRSIAIIMASGIEYEFRTTAVAEFHTPDDFEQIGSLILGAKNYYIQKFKDSGELISSNLHPLSDEDMLKCAEKAAKYVENVGLRGV